MSASMPGSAVATGGDEPLSVACLGAGYFAQYHHDAWRRIDRTDLAGVADRDTEKATASAAPAFAGLEEMLEATAPDILDIVVPPPAHAASIRAGLDAGVRLIACQKPFCTSLDEAREMTELAERRGIPLVVHENFRFQPWYRAMRDIIAAGRIGEVQQISFRLRPGDGRGPRAYLDRQPYFQQMERFLIHETGVHWIDTFQFLMGPPRAVFADLRRLNPVIAGEDAGYFIMDHGEGRRSLFDGNRLLDHVADNCRLTMGDALVEGTTGTLALDGMGSVSLRLFGEKESEEVFAPSAWPGFGGDCVMALNDHLVSHLLDGTPLENRARDYLEIIEIEEALYRSSAEGRRIALRQ